MLLFETILAARSTKHTISPLNFGSIIFIRRQNGYDHAFKKSFLNNEILKFSEKEERNNLRNCQEDDQKIHTVPYIQYTI